MTGQLLHLPAAERGAGADSADLGGGLGAIDTVAGENGAYRYTADLGDLPGLSFAPEKGGFAVTDEQQAVMARYILKSGCLKRRPVTDFTAMDYLR